MRSSRRILLPTSARKNTKKGPINKVKKGPLIAELIREKVWERDDFVQLPAPSS